MEEKKEWNKLLSWGWHPRLGTKCPYEVIRKLLPPDKRKGDLLTVIIEYNLADTNTFDVHFAITLFEPFADDCYLNATIDAYFQLTVTSDFKFPNKLDDEYSYYLGMPLQHAVSEFINSTQQKLISNPKTSQIVLRTFAPQEFINGLKGAIVQRKDLN